MTRMVLGSSQRFDLWYETPPIDLEWDADFAENFLVQVLRKRYERTGSIENILRIESARFLDRVNSEYLYSREQTSNAVLAVLSTIDSECRIILRVSGDPVPSSAFALTDDEIDVPTLRRYFSHYYPEMYQIPAEYRRAQYRMIYPAEWGIQTEWCPAPAPSGYDGFDELTPTDAAALFEEPCEQPTTMFKEVPDFTQSNRRFGIEFEFSTRHLRGDIWERYSAALNRAFSNVRVTDYEHSDGTCWHLKPDSSCGMELASPALTWDDWGDVETAVNILHTLNSRIDDTCGLHVHHDLSDFTIVQLRRLVVLWATFEDVIFGLVNEQRKSNRFCMPLKSELDYQTWNSLIEPIADLMHFRGFIMNGFGRYRALNCTGWWNHGRVEMRLLEGTLDINLVKFWVFVTQRFVEIARNHKNYTALEKAYNSRGVEELENLLVELLEMDLNKEHREEFRNLWKIRYKTPSLMERSR